MPRTTAIVPHSQATLNSHTPTHTAALITLIMGNTQPPTLAPAQLPPSDSSRSEQESRQTPPVQLPSYPAPLSAKGLGMAASKSWAEPKEKNKIGKEVGKPTVYSLRTYYPCGLIFCKSICSSGKIGGRRRRDFGWREKDWRVKGGIKVPWGPFFDGCLYACPVDNSSWWISTNVLGTLKWFEAAKVKRIHYG